MSGSDVVGVLVLDKSGEVVVCMYSTPRLEAAANCYKLEAM